MMGLVISLLAMFMWSLEEYTEVRYESEWRLYRWWLRRAGYEPTSLHDFNRFCTELRVQLVILGQETSNVDEVELLGSREININQIRED